MDQAEIAATYSTDIILNLSILITHALIAEQKERVKVLRRLREQFENEITQPQF